MTRRFPELRFAFLEGGVGWACQLFGDLLEHWERRSAKALERMDPRKLDPKLLMSLAEKYGDSDVVAALHARNGWPDHDPSLTGGVADLDDFSACKITRKQDWIDLYVKPFYFGCEADDRANAWAFSKNNPFESKLNALYSSDIGHFDVIDMRDPLAEAHELVDDGLITPDNFRDFTFANAVHLWGTQNPRFFEGTAVARAAAEELKRPRGTRRRTRSSANRPHTGQALRVRPERRGRGAAGRGRPWALGRRARGRRLRARIRGSSVGNAGEVDEAALGVSVDELHAYPIADVETLEALNDFPFRRRPQDAHPRVLVPPRSTCACTAGSISLIGTRARTDACAQSGCSADHPICVLCRRSP